MIDFRVIWIPEVLLQVMLSKVELSESFCILKTFACVSILSFDFATAMDFYGFLKVD